MKRLFAASMALLMILACCACDMAAQGEATPEEPVIEGLEKVFGGQVSIALLSDSEAFSYGAKLQAEALGVTLNEIDDIALASDSDILIAYMPDEAEVSALTQGAIVYGGDAEYALGSGYTITYSADEAVSLALDALYTYPSHEAPVRVVCMFGAEDSFAANACESMRAEGKLHVKGNIALGTDTDMEGAEKALASTLKDIIPGLLDTVFTEDAETALTAYDVLKSAQRGDAVEVITAGLNGDIIAAMAEEHFLMGAAVGADEYSAGALAVRMAAAKLAGDAVESVELTPITVYSSDIYAALKEATETDLSALLLSMDEQTNGLYVTEDMEYLTEYYG